MTERKADLGVVGLGVMGANLALNAADKGFTVAVYNRTPDKTEELVSANPEKALLGATTFAELASMLERPRKLLLMVKAGAPVDATLDDLLHHLEEGDLVIDGGNEHFTQTERRGARLQGHGLELVGMGVSGGEEGARNGPSLMPGCSEGAYRALAPLLEELAAQVEDGPCVTHVGPGGAGHYVKMVHNGIEYGDMQLIAEIYDVLRRVGGLTNDQLAETFEAWNGGELESFLIEITGRIFRRRDAETGRHLVDLILDTAQMKGTGSWAVKDAAELGTPAPTIASAVDARLLSAAHALRAKGAALLAGPAPAPPGEDRAAIVADARAALYAAKACSYAQGMALLRAASEARTWDLRLDEIARIWKGGCIIRAAFLGRIQEAYRRDPALPNLLFDPSFASELASRQDAWRRTVQRAILAGVPVPTLTASLGYYDSLRSARLPANLTQAQRDLFGAHTYQRVDRDGVFHSDWSSDNDEA